MVPTSVNVTPYKHLTGGLFTPIWTAYGCLMGTLWAPMGTLGDWPDVPKTGNDITHFPPPPYKWLMACLQAVYRCLMGSLWSPYGWLMGGLQAPYSQFMALQVTYRCLMDSLWVPYGQLIGALWVPLENSDWPMVPSTVNDITDITTSFT